MSFSDTLRRLGLRPAGGNHRVLCNWLARWEISTAHFDRHAAGRSVRRGTTVPLVDVLVERSGYSRRRLKHRLFEEGLKERACELCGQDEEWKGRRMSLILDHVNGVADDNRLENLQVVCPNCAATLDTHCGRNARIPRDARECPMCGTSYEPKYSRQKYCSYQCSHSPDRLRAPRPATRKVERPPYGRLLEDLESSSYLAVGRKYGVSDNAVRKWIRWYEHGLPASGSEG